MKQEIELKTENVKRMGKQISITLKGCKNMLNFYYTRFFSLFTSSNNKRNINKS